MKNFITNLRAKAQEGFTLVELMVVVAIIGLLSAVAIPNFKKYQAKAKTSEAKLQLSAMYTGQQSFYMDFDNYGTALNVQGFDPSNESLSRYYAVGFEVHNATAGALANNNGASAVLTTAGVIIASGSNPTTSQHAYLYGAGKKVGAAAAMTPANFQTNTASDTATVGDDGQTFSVSAVGVISADKTAVADADVWSMNQDKVLRQDAVGF